MKDRYVPSSVSGYMVDRATKAIINTNQSEKQIYDAQIERFLIQQTHKVEMDELKKKLEMLESLVLKYLPV